MFVIFPLYVLHRYIIWAYSHPFCCYDICAHLEYIQSNTRVVAWVRGHSWCLFSYLSLSLRRVAMICRTRDGLFAFYLFYALPMLKFCCSSDVYTYMSNLIIFRYWVLLTMLCWYSYALMKHVWHYDHGVLFNFFY